MLAAAALAGCVSYQPKPIDLTQQASRLESRHLNDPALAHYAASLDIPVWPPQRWTRGDLLVAALFYSPDIAEARTRLLAARAGEKTAAQYPNPSLTLGSEYELAAASAGAAPWLYGILVQVLLPRTNLRHAQQLKAAFFTQAAGWALAQSVWSVRSRLRAALLDTRHAEAAATVLTREARDARRLAELVTAQVAAGEAAAPQAQLALAQALRAEQQRDTMRAQAAAGRHTLAATIGIPVTALPPLQTIWADWRSPSVPPQPALAALEQRALLSRADLASAVAQYQAAEQALRIEIDRQYPGITLGPGYTFDHGARKLPLSISFDLPIFNQNQGPIAEAEARRVQAGTHLEALQAQILGQIAAARDREQRATKLARNFQRQQLPLAEQRLEAARQAFAAGQDDRAALLSTQIEAEQTRLAALHADLEAQSALGALEDALHHPFDASEQALVGKQGRSTRPESP